MCDTQSEVTFTEKDITREVEAGDAGADFPKEGEVDFPAKLKVTSAVFNVQGTMVQLAADFRFGDVYSKEETCKAALLTYTGSKIRALCKANATGEIQVEWVPGRLGGFTVTGRFVGVSLELHPPA